MICSGLTSEISALTSGIFAFFPGTYTVDPKLEGILFLTYSTQYCLFTETTQGVHCCLFAIMTTEKTIALQNYRQQGQLFEYFGTILTGHFCQV